ncbi:hypothetical protein [Ruegeria lacuscaerulensis]|uniref:hypothetical protein n=1 Tax=Ruegeria lacuscaerulensis TaxID=55218 RepID=UPI00147C10FE|nr:hypothetical protein [Ruegeria lacuscaerulensis]
MIGFHLFPVGWTWNEYPTLCDEDHVGYEQPARSAIHQIEKSLPTPRSFSRLSGSAAQFRRFHVESRLRQIIDRRTVRLYEGPLAEPRALKEFGKDERGLDDRDRRLIRVAQSVVGFRMYSKRVCELDARELVEDLLRKIENRGGDSKHDWLLVELWLRHSIETKGIPNNSAERVSELQLWCASRENEELPEPPTERCRSILKSLIDEYGYVVKTGFFPL